MIIDILTGFPELFTGLVNSSIVRQALLGNAVEVWVHNLRHYSLDRHGNIDDSPYGGGAGMVLMAQPVFAAVDDLRRTRGTPAQLVYLTPQGVPLVQKRVHELARAERLVLLCGHYKDVDGRVFERDSWTEISIGDYVLSGGELAAAVLTDAVVRLLPGAMSDPDSADTDSFEDGLLDASYYTRPEEIEGLRVPEPLLSGHHANIARWRSSQRAERTRNRRPDLWNAYLSSHLDLKND
jgi:tRNA (guanine37-N1)-methyltransferase